MIVCVCRNLNDAAVARAVGSGARSPGQVFRVLEEKPECRLCFACLKDRLQTMTAPQALAATPSVGVTLPRAAPGAATDGADSAACGPEPACGAAEPPCAVSRRR